MKNTGRLVLIFAFLLAILTAGGTYYYLSSIDSSNTLEVPMKTVFVARDDIEPRTLINDGLIEAVEVPEGDDIGSYVTSRDKIIGMYANEKIYKKERFHTNKLVDKVADQLNLKVVGSHRAVAVSINGASGIANILVPGDRVDVVAVLPELKENNRIVRPDVAKIILQNVEVLAIDKALYEASKSDIVDGDSVTKEDEASKIFIATLSVPFQNLEPIALVERIGSIELALRPLEGDYVYKTEGTVWQELLLNEFGEMKDMFPTYEIVSNSETLISEGDVVYDKYTYYTVQYGDNLRSISMKFYGTDANYKLLKQVNKIADENVIVTGTGIKIPVMWEAGENND